MTEDVVATSLRSRADLLGRVQGKAPGEDRQPAQHGPLGLGEQPVAPVHRRPQCRLAGYGRARPCRQEVETVGQGLGDPLHAHHAHPGGGQLDGKGDAVQREQMAATAGALPSVMAKFGEAPARSANKRAASEASRAGCLGELVPRHR